MKRMRTREKLNYYAMFILSLIAALGICMLVEIKRKDKIEERISEIDGQLLFLENSLQQTDSTLIYMSRQSNENKYDIVMIKRSVSEIRSKLNAK